LYKINQEKCCFLTQFFVDFELGRYKDHEIRYNTEGKILNHKEEISKRELPKVVYNSIKRNFNSYYLDDLHRITDSEKVIYTIELNSLIQQDWDLITDSNGNILSKTAN